jgi:surface antigen
VITPVRTFRSESGQWCREFVRVVEGPSDRETLRGIACREGEGHWRPRIWSHEAVSG